jgi:hypothetical protein
MAEKKLNANDKKILALQKEIASRELMLGKTTGFNPITNCSLTIDSKTVNIQTLSSEDLLLYIARFKSLEMGLQSEIPDAVLNIGGFSISDWITDLKSRYFILNIKNERTRLSTLKQKLSELLTSETKVELEIDKLSQML